MKENNKIEIIEALRKNPKGLTILNIAEIIGMSRITVSKYIYGLVTENLVEQKQVGPAKLCFLSDKE